MNSVETKNESFNLDSDAETRKIFLRFKRKNSAIEISQEKGNSLYHGFFDLHQDLISALGKNPPLFLDNKYKQIKLRGFSELKRFKLLFGYSSSKPKHSLTAKTPAMRLLLNLDREIEQFAAEVSWERSKRFIPYFRHYSSTDEGNGINLKDEKFKFGYSKTKLKATTNSLGFAFPLSSAKCFFEYSKTDFDSFMSMETNLITLDPLFLFSTNQVDYDLKFQPNSGWGTRLGGKKKFGRFELAGQYSFLTFKGTSALNSRKYKGLFATRIDKSALRKTELKLHRMSITTKKHDRFGSWAVNLNLILPLAESKKANIQALPPLPPTPPAPLKPKAKESVRGSWQINVSREFRF
ncbi:MAG: hypothetical protein GX221_04875 [Candidatus Riflebacteria bacterium]|nr:hypothetical protein [Candidatus Riflebacteria bacterium]